MHMPMPVLKTIVATAVIVFTLTTVAMAGVDHFTGENGQASQVRTQVVPATVTLTARQFQQLVRGQDRARTAQNQRQTGRGSQQDQASRHGDDQNGSSHTSAQSSHAYSAQSATRIGSTCYENGSGHTVCGSSGDSQSGGDRCDGGDGGDGGCR